ncbi:MAG: 2-oxoglutarate dehydrogenase [Oscillospiraceae bacterium]|nr:2-oxoglutarate dehydrogenase [Oscillospiraceae bacterium]
MDNTTPKRKKRWGDRSDGRLLRSLEPFYTFIPFIMKERSDASNFFADSLDISAADAYLRQKREEGLKGIGMLHLFLAAYVRCVAQYPGINRFVAGQRVYARNDIAISMAVKRSFSLGKGETTIKVILEPTDKIEDIFRKMNVEVSKIKDSPEANGVDKVVGIFKKFPRPIFRFAVKLLYWMDYHGLIPKALLHISPFHASFFITDLGSLGIPPIYHHLYNFGTVPVFLAFGAKHKQIYTKPDGTTEIRRYIDYKIVTDERICDGHYYATAFKHIKHYLRNPHLLDEPVTPVEDVD